MLNEVRETILYVSIKERINKRSGKEVETMWIYSIGLNNRYGSEFSIERPKWSWDYLFLHINTPALFIIDGKKINAQANSVIIYHVNSEHRYYANGPVYSDDYIHFHFDDDYPIMNDLNLPFNELIQLPEHSDIPSMLKFINKEFVSVNLMKDRTIDLLMKLMFTKISEYNSIPMQTHLHNAYYGKLLKLRTKIYSNPGEKWNVEDMAKNLNLSASYFQSLYKKTFLCSCINDVIRSRIEHAKYLLIKTDFSINEISTLCGYQNSTFFMRQFKNLTGTTPSEHRTKYQ